MQSSCRNSQSKVDNQTGDNLIHLLPSQLQPSISKRKLTADDGFHCPSLTKKGKVEIVQTIPNIAVNMSSNQAPVKSTKLSVKNFKRTYVYTRTVVVTESLWCNLHAIDIAFIDSFTVITLAVNLFHK